MDGANLGAAQVLPELIDQLTNCINELDGGQTRSQDWKESVRRLASSTTALTNSKAAVTSADTVQGKPWDVEARIALSYFHRYKDHTSGKLLLVSDLGLRRTMDSTLSLGQWLQIRLEQAVNDAGLCLDIRTNHVGILCITTRNRFLALRKAGRLPCPHCCQWLKGDKGLWWHQQQTHAQSHSDAMGTATRTVSTNAMVVYDPNAMRIHATDMECVPIPRQPNTTSMNPVQLVQLGDSAAIHQLIAQGFDPASFVDSKGASLLLWAAGAGHVDMAKRLIESGCDPNFAQRGRRGFQGRTALHWAARNGHLEMVRFLVEDQRVRLEAKTADGTTAFCWAAWQGHTQVMEYLHGQGCDVSSVNSFGCNAVLWAAQGNGTPEVIRWLDSVGCSCLVLNENNHGLLHKAAQRGKQALCEWFLETKVRGLDSRFDSLEMIRPDTDSCMPSDLAGMEGHQSLAEYLFAEERSLLVMNLSKESFVMPVWLRDVTPMEALSVWEPHAGMKRLRLVADRPLNLSLLVSARAVRNDHVCNRLGHMLSYRCTEGDKLIDKLYLSHTIADKQRNARPTPLKQSASSMSFWEGANVAPRSHETDRAMRGSRETVEAALNRLSKAYESAMECVNAWHRADDSLNVDVMVKVGRAARRALEEGLLWDPLILPHLSALSGTFSARSKRKSPELTSAAHQEMVKKLAYLSLVNLADLLMAGVPSVTRSNNSLLERGVFQTLKSFQESVVSCWDETEEQTVRVALLAALDAVAIDDSDPTRWLKLACLARRLGRVLDHSGGVKPAFLLHRRLEKHALHMGAKALPPGQPPSRLIQRAIKEFEEEEDPSDYVLPSRNPHGYSNRTLIVITRYNSWSTLARTLLRLVRGMGSHGNHAARPLLEDSTHSVAGGASSVVEIELAPIITLPATIAGSICAFLNPSDQHALEVTCKELSFLVMASRAALDHSQTMAKEVNSLQEHQLNVDVEKSNDASVQGSQFNSANQEPRDAAEHEDSTAPVNRVSKRLRTQMITEEKRTERLNRRQSVSYCVRAVVHQVDPDSDVRAELKFDWNRTLPPEIARPVPQVISKGSRGQNENRVCAGIDERMGDSSLAAFLSIPWAISTRGLLFRLVAHVSLHIGDVFACDRGSSLVLSSSLHECIDLLLRTSSYQTELSPSWSNGTLKAPADAKLELLELFSIDLLHAELLLVRVELQENVSCGFDSESSRLALLVPCLEKVLKEVEIISAGVRARLVEMRARYHWLATRYYLFKSSMAQNVSESRSAEQFAIDCLDQTIQILGASGKVVIPHIAMGSKKRCCDVLTPSSLHSFRNDIEASSVILTTQEAFLESLSRLTADQANLVKMDDLWEVGQALAQRYDVGGMVWNMKIQEIVDDFVDKHCDSLVQDYGESSLVSSQLQVWFDSLVPASSIDRATLLALASYPSVSILSILSTCHAVKDEVNSLLQLYGRVVVAISVYCRSKLSHDDPLQSSDSEYDSDDDSAYDYDASSKERSFLKKSLRPHIALLLQLIQKMQHLLQESPFDKGIDFVKSPLCSVMIELSLYVCAEWASFNPHLQHEISSDTREDFEILLAVTGLILSVKTTHGLCDNLYQTFLTGCAYVIVRQSGVLTLIVRNKKGQTGRYLRQRLGRMIGDTLVHACCVFALELSEDRHDISTTMLSEICESLLCLWEIAATNELNLRDFLNVPVATALVSVLGLAAKRQCEAPGGPSISDFYDSDASARDWLPDNQDTVDGRNMQHLRVLGQTVHAINGIFLQIDENAATSYDGCESYLHDSGPLLPLIASRVLNRIADTLLVSFSDSRDDLVRRRAVWNDYPVGTRSIGRLLDTLLHKAYKCLHLFVLSNNNELRDAAAPSNSSLKSHRYRPESLDAAVSLYRCIMRAYSHGRKSPPKAALDTVLDALPPLRVNSGGKGDALRTFLFSPQNGPSLHRLESVVSEVGDWQDWFQGVASFCSASHATDNEEDIATLVRSGISNLIAQGGVPELVSECDRSESARIEEELSKKFFALLDTLCLGDASDCQKWYKAAECLVEKANLIADRIGQHKGFVREDCLTLPCRIPVRDAQIKMDHTIRPSTDNEYQVIDSLGHDLSLYVRCTWSSFSSLQELDAEISSFRIEASSGHPEHAFHEDIQRCFQRKDYHLWQEAWGGVFVATLRSLAKRCICLALFILFHREDASSDATRQLISEFTEFLGIILYSEVSGSQAFGYPMRPLTTAKKRELAKAALTCFTKAADLLDGEKEGLEISHLCFMQGKCLEKMANAFRHEEGFNDSVKTKMQTYEKMMTRALTKYSESLDAATKSDGGGTRDADLNGGSEHGSAEVLYRIHATRLKCLLHALKYRDERRDLAESEALRITELFWFKEPANQPMTTRERVWAVLTDVVDAMVKCRIDHSYFHRSVYRHAQALLWAPIFENPDSHEATGFLGTVSASKAANLRGFNSTSALSSAATVINTLFEKRRSQLCAVWVTSGATSPFAIINQTARKFDTLRGKYISAYLEILRLSKNRDAIETFMKAVYGCGRDLPSFFAASAKAQGGLPEAHHSKDPLLPVDRSLASQYFLTSVKRSANGCLAYVLLEEVRSATATTASAKENILKAAYSCFLRLNCDVKQLNKAISTWKLHRQYDPIEAVAQCLIETFQQQKDGSLVLAPTDDWSGPSNLSPVLDAAIGHCRTAFPSVTGTFYLKKPVQKKKRKEPAPVGNQKAYDIKVPEGASAGDTFVVSVAVDGQPKKVRLTVPDPVPTVMRFCLPSLAPESKASAVTDTKNE